MSLTGHRYLEEDKEGSKIAGDAIDQSKLKEEQTQKDNLFEQVMSLMAISRAVIWIPIPLCIIVAKVDRFDGFSFHRLISPPSSQNRSIKFTCSCFQRRNR